MANKAPGEHRRNTSLSEKLKNGQTDLRKTQNRKPKKPAASVFSQHARL
jgi:hypothetical protein